MFGDSAFFHKNFLQTLFFENLIFFFFFFFFVIKNAKIYNVMYKLVLGGGGEEANTHTGAKKWLGVRGAFFAGLATLLTLLFLLLPHFTSDFLFYSDKHTLGKKKISPLMRKFV